MVQFADYLTSTADILNLTTDDGELRVDLGDIRTGAGISSESPVWQFDGFVSVPNEPDTDTKESARALYFIDGDEKIVIGTYDARFAEKVGELKAGDRMMFGKGEQRFLLKQDTESATMYTVNKNTGSSQIITANGKDGVNMFVNGNTLIQQEDDKIILAVNGGAWIEINKDGIIIGGKSCTIACPKGQLGAPAPGVVLPPGASSIIFGPAGIVGVASANWTVSP